MGPGSDHTPVAAAAVTMPTAVSPAALKRFPTGMTFLLSEISPGGPRGHSVQGRLAGERRGATVSHAAAPGAVLVAGSRARRRERCSARVVFYDERTAGRTLRSPWGAALRDWVAACGRSRACRVPGRR